MIDFTTLNELLERKETLDEETLEAAGQIVDDVRRLGSAGMRYHAGKLDGLKRDESAWLGQDALAAACNRIPRAHHGVLQRTAARIAAFAQAQKGSLRGFSRTADGFEMHQEVAPLSRAGCYAPGGRYPLPSSVLMTAVTARVAGVQQVVVASPNPDDVTLAAAYVAGAQGVLRVGGAQAIAAMAYGVGECAACDVVVGPGNRFVTAAKQLVSRHVGIDMLAGPSELVVVADETANASFVAADLLAQAEHDEDACAILIAFDEATARRVQAEVVRQLADLPTRDTARAALRNSGMLVAGPADAAHACNALAPEHLALHLEDLDGFRQKLWHFGAVFEGGFAAEVFGDYGVGPNHVLPTGGLARSRGGLSVFDFLRVRTRLTAHAAPDPEVLADVETLARLEGLIGHARSAAIRGLPSNGRAT